jgi:hypothetical protein
MNPVLLTSTSLPTVYPASTLPTVNPFLSGVVLRRVGQTAGNGKGTTLRYQEHQPDSTTKSSLLTAGKITARRIAITKQSAAMRKEIGMFLDVEQQLGRAQTLLAASRVEHVSRRDMLDKLLMPTVAPDK